MIFSKSPTIIPSFHTEESRYRKFLAREPEVTFTHILKKLLEINLSVLIFWVTRMLVAHFKCHKTENSLTATLEGLWHFHSCTLWQRDPPFFLPAGTWPRRKTTLLSVWHLQESQGIFWLWKLHSSFQELTTHLRHIQCSLFGPHEIPQHFPSSGERKFMECRLKY